MLCVCAPSPFPFSHQPVALLPLAQRQREAGESSSPLDECCVCMDAIPEDCAVALPCAHLFHKACRDQLCTYNYDTNQTTPNKNKCPICRIDFNEGVPDSVVDSVLQGISNISVQEGEAEAAWLAPLRDRPLVLDDFKGMPQGTVLRLYYEGEGEGSVLRLHHNSFRISKAWSCSLRTSRTSLRRCPALCYYSLDFFDANSHLPGGRSGGL